MRNKNIYLEWIIILSIENMVVNILHITKKTGRILYLISILIELQRSMFSKFELFSDSTLIKMP